MPSSGPALRFGDPRVQALALALCTSVLAVTGITNKSLRALANNETVELIGRAGGEMTGIAPIDLTEPEQASKMIEDAVAAYGGLDVVYNNVAIHTSARCPISLSMTGGRP